MTYANTHPEQIVDKNGVVTTRHKKNDTPAGSARPASVAPTIQSDRPFANYTPAEVDVPLAEIYDRQERVRFEIEKLKKWANDYRNSAERALEKAKRVRQMYLDQGDEERAAYWANGEETSDYKTYTEQAEKYESQIPPLEDSLAELEAEADPYELEFAKRGGWSRFFQVTNSNGHVHRSMECSTCYPTTMFYWHADRSGSTDDEIIEAAGTNACTVCFPDAPVEKLNQPGVMETPDMISKREAREERERKAAEKKAAAIAKGITNPDGTPLRGRWGVYKTERAAEIDLVDGLITAYSPWMQNDSMKEEYKKQSVSIFEAILHKRGVSREELTETILTKVKAKLKREGSSVSDFERYYDPNLFR